ncbi:MAG TPA: hypothetical protein VEG39_02235 [Clostridia bacterium]|nr:hypothetical protein [Clostridia bacterium]
MFKSKRINMLIVITILVAVLWLIRLIPSGICILAAKSYMEDKYPERKFRYSFVEYSSNHGKYFVHFVDKDGNRTNVMTTVFGVDYDPLDPPG